jgi:hypothetical protein
MEVSGQFHAAANLPPGRSTVFVDYEAGWPSEPVGTLRAGRDSQSREEFVRLSEIEPRFLGLVEGRILFSVKPGATVREVTTGLEETFLNWWLTACRRGGSVFIILISLDTLEINKKYVESFEIWRWKRMEISWTDYVKKWSMAQSQGREQYRTYNKMKED